MCFLFFCATEKVYLDCSKAIANTETVEHYGERDTPDEWLIKDAFDLKSMKSCNESECSKYFAFKWNSSNL